MTIRPGQEWGVEVPLPAGAFVAHTDAEVASAATGADVVLAGGDLHRSVGSPPARDPVRRVPIDGLVVRLDGSAPHHAVAHVVIRRSWWRGDVVAVMNTDHLGEWYVAPRAHPNDGRFDVVAADGALRVRDRLAARRRLRSGSHVPHPDIATSRERARTWTFARPHRVWIDGRRAGSARTIEVTVDPDRYVVHF
jgi:hypothetical protein